MKHAQGGAILIALLLVILIAAFGTALSSGDLAARAALREQLSSMGALAQARSALIGYAVSYAERHPGQGYGYLPCPDSGNTGASAAGSCAPRGHGVFGRLPYRTLGLPDLRDGRGDCLWYAVAGSAKNNPKPLALNWDSPGQFSIHDVSGHPVASPSGGPESAVAVVFAPGAPLPIQSRPAASAGRCPGSAEAARDLPTFLDADYPTATTLALPVRQGLTTSEKNNDLITWITTDDVFDVLRRRHDFPILIQRIIDRTTAAIAGAPPALLALHASHTDGTRIHGTMPDADTLGIADEDADRHDNWRDQFRFVACSDGSQCLEAMLTDSILTTEPPTLETCRVIVLFGGERIRDGVGIQSRQRPDERADPAQYLEPPNSDSFESGTGGFQGSRHFTVPALGRPASADIVRCIP